MADGVVVPETITVHLGKPNENAPNVTVPFVDYIKNVASSEIYPTWPESAIRANIYAQISIALNRIFTEYYRSRGYDFDITNSTQYDQAFVYGRDYFSNISEIVDNIFNSYVVRQGTVNPYFTEYCDGINVTCPGLSQWGTVELANRGYSPYEILQYYYGDDINIEQADVGGNVESYPGKPLSLGSVGEEVKIIQQELNRISRNYPLIPRIAEANGYFEADTQNAVRVFQQIFDLTPDGIVGKATWYQIKRIYNAVKRTSELFSEGISISEAMRRFPSDLRLGSRGIGVSTLQFYLSLLSYFIPTIPNV
ncbi:MAG: peptidoglycan-binding protein, partial [Acutalibacteraceae bacterium]